MKLYSFVSHSSNVVDDCSFKKSHDGFESLKLFIVYSFWRLDKNSVDTIAHSNVDSVFEGKVVNSLIKRLVQLRNEKKYSALYQLISDIFCDDLDNSDFLSWLCKRMDIKYSYFITRFNAWRKNDFKDVRGKHSKVTPEMSQNIYDLWIENSIPSVDCRNGREFVKIRKSDYVKRYGNITNSPQLEENKKRGTIVYITTRRVVTCTVRKMKSLIMEKYDYNVSLGKINYLKPFFLTTPTEKEKVLCMCKRCLNTRLTFDVIMSHMRKYGGEEYQSISDYLMAHCKCVKNANGYYDLKCCLGECSECKDNNPPNVPGLDIGVKINYFIYETTKTPYADKNGVQKLSQKTERVSYQNVDIKDVVHNFLESSREYLLHRYEIANDKYVWKNVLNTVSKIGPIFHFDYSENIQLTPKYEPQSAHFNKKQFSLHCTVAHVGDIDGDDDDRFKYLYHISDDNKHDYGFTFSVVESIINTFDERALLLILKFYDYFHHLSNGRLSS